MKMSKMFGLLAVIAIGSVCLIKGTNPVKNNIDINDLPISIMQVSYVIDINNPKEIVGDADYVFLGTVDEMIGTQYKGDGRHALPYTDYNIIVNKNIKGELVTDVPMTIQKDGGVNREYTMVSIYEDDMLPQIGCAYIFSAYVQSDGSLLIAGANSNIPVTSSYTGGDVNTLMQSPEFLTYMDAFENEVATDRERFVFDYNANSN